MREYTLDLINTFSFPVSFLVFLLHIKTENNQKSTMEIVLLNLGDPKTNPHTKFGVEMTSLLRVTTPAALLLF